VPVTPIAANFHKAFDIKVNLSPELPLHPIFPVDNFPEVINLPLSQVIRLNFSIDAGLSQNPMTQRGADAVNIL
jgi:hypothetical protein